MKKLAQMLFSAILALCSTLDVSAQEVMPAVSVLPTKMAFYLYPDNLAPRRGHKVEFRSIAQDGMTVTAIVTMYGPGQGGCAIKDNLAKGTFNGQRIEMAVVTENKTTCPMSFTLDLGTKEFEGRFVNEPYAGGVKVN